VVRYNAEFGCKFGGKFDYKIIMDIEEIYCSHDCYKQKEINMI
jgi:hypothetical protein